MARGLKHTPAAQLMLPPPLAAAPRTAAESCRPQSLISTPHNPQRARLLLCDEY